MAQIVWADSPVAVHCQHLHNTNSVSWAVPNFILNMILESLRTYTLRSQANKSLVPNSIDELYSNLLVASRPSSASSVKERLETCGAPRVKASALKVT